MAGWDRKTTMEYLQPFVGIYDSGILGTSYMDQWKNNQLLQYGIRSQKSQINPTVYKNMNREFNLGKANAAIGAGFTAANALTNIANTGLRAAQINVPEEYYDQLNQYSQLGTGDYNSFGQIASEQQQFGLPNSPDYDDIRGMNGWQKASSLGSAALSGAAAGAQIGGPWGAVAGAAIGLAGAGVGILRGNADARLEEETAGLRRRAAIASAESNTEAATEDLRNRNYRNSYMNSNAYGGKIERRQQTLKEFADAVLGKQKTTASRSAGIVRKKAEGGTMIRIKV